jgi:hypothetical protein
MMGHFCFMIYIFCTKRKHNKHCLGKTKQIYLSPLMAWIINASGIKNFSLCLTLFMKLYKLWRIQFHGGEKSGFSKACRSWPVELAGNRWHNSRMTACGLPNVFMSELKSIPSWWEYEAGSGTELEQWGIQINNTLQIFFIELNILLARISSEK